MTRGVEEGYGRAVQRNGVCAYVLGYAARFAACDIRLADVVEQGGLAVVDMTHDGDDGGTRNELCHIFVVDVELFGERFLESDLGLELQLDGIRRGDFADDELRGCEVHALVDGLDYVEEEQLFDDFRRGNARLFAEHLDGHGVGGDDGVLDDAHLSAACGLGFALEHAHPRVFVVKHHLAAVDDVPLLEQRALVHRASVVGTLPACGLGVVLAPLRRALSGCGHLHGHPRQRRSPLLTGPCKTALRTRTLRSLALRARRPSARIAALENAGLDCGLLRGGRRDIYLAYAPSGSISVCTEGLDGSVIIRLTSSFGLAG